MVLGQPGGGVRPVLVGRAALGSVRRRAVIPLPTVVLARAVPAVPLLLLMLFAAGGPARAAAAPAFRCADFLAQQHLKPSHAVFMGCHPFPTQQGKPMRATYRINGRHAAAAEAFLARTIGLARLRRSCCQWDAPPRSFIGMNGRDFMLTMVSDETAVRRREHWTLIRGFTITVDAFTEDI